jgi:hypothetical protein
VHLETSGCYPIKPTHKKTLGEKGQTKKKKKKKKKKEKETTNRKGKKRQHTGGARNPQKKETLPCAYRQVVLHVTFVQSTASASYKD